MPKKKTITNSTWKKVHAVNKWKLRLVKSIKNYIWTWQLFSYIHFNVIRKALKMSRKEFFLLIFLFQRADAKCDNERCPPMEGAQASIFSCGVVISGTGENTKCGYLIKPRDKFPVQEERCKSTKIVKRRKADYVIS